MSEKILYLFPDTNLFIECKPLAELDWSEWSEFTEIHLIVCRPVTRELDYQKGRGNSRVARRARSTYQFFAPLAEDGKDFLEIQNSTPVVKLFLEGMGQPSPELKETLDYSQTDDQIVGSLHRFRRDNPEADARLLTGDRGPMMAARSLELPRVPIREAWRLPPEQNEVEKENTRLRQRVIQLEKAEPSFDVQLIDDNEEPLKNLRVEFEVFEPLSEQEVNALVQLIAENLPVVTAFPNDPPTREDNSTAVGIFYLPTHGEIAKYKEQAYPEWLEKCRTALSNIHTDLQREAGPPSFSLSIANEGTRPGKDTLVNIIAEGNFEISPPPFGSASEGAFQEGPSLPYPPQPPQGRWGSQGNSRRTPRSLRISTKDRGPLHSLRSTIRALYPISNPSTTPPDPNTVYFRHERPDLPEKIITLECQQWRHGTGSVIFQGDLHFDLSSESARGLLICEVHAENLSAHVREQFPVRITTRKSASTDPARDLVQKLIDSAK